MFPDCLKDLVGIGEIGCSSTSLASDKSSTGLFVTQDPSYNHCRFQSGDSACDLLKRFIQMRDEAYRQLTTDIGAVLASKIQTKVDSTYDIGQNEFGNYMNTLNIPAKPSLRIATEIREGAFIEIRKIALMLAPISAAFTVNLRVIRESDGVVLKTIPFQIAAISKVRRDVETLKLPCNGEVYIFEYDYDSSAFFVPTSNYHCGCGDKLKNAAGFILESKTVETYGIALYVNLACDAGMKVCALLKNTDYRNVIGYMIRKKVIELTLKHEMFKQEVNKYTLLASDDLGALIGIYEAEYSERLKWIAYQNSFEVDGFCLTCNNGMRKVSLLRGR